MGTVQLRGINMGLIGNGPGGYIDFLSIVRYKAEGISPFWSLGIATSMGIMFAAMTKIIIEWCTQSHLSTEEYSEALKGLEATRKWKFFWFRVFSSGLYCFLAYPWICRKFVRRIIYCNCSEQQRESTLSACSESISWQPMIRDYTYDNVESYPLTDTSFSNGRPAG